MVVSKPSVVATLLEFSAAFDSVDHVIVIRLKTKYRVRGLLLIGLHPTAVIEAIKLKLIDTIRLSIVSI